jgi:[ribosomal protein S5]-alanine N-acetyltransferase
LSEDTHPRRAPADRMFTSIPGRAWPNVLMSGTDPTVTLRPIRRSDAGAWRAARQRNQVWLAPWDATVPPGGEARPTSFRALVKRLSKAGRRGTNYPFVIEVDGRFAGQVSINNIVRGSAQFASVGYWIDQEFAGRGVMPRAVAMAIDHCFFTAGLHRIEVCIRPENSNSLRIVEKLGIREVGYAPRFLHIDGDWRDHRIFAITKEEVPRGVLARWVESGGDVSAVAGR